MPDLDEITIREFVGGHEDGTLAVVPPGGEKEIKRTSTITHFGDDGQVYESKGGYVFSHEEVTIVRLRKWFYKFEAQAD